MTEQTPENNTPAADAGPIKDKPRPITIYQDEHAKTLAVQKEAADQRKVVDDAYNALNKSFIPKLEALDKSMKEAGEQRLTVRRESVTKLTEEVGASEKTLAELQAKILEEREKLWRSQDALHGAQKELNAEGKKLRKEHLAARSQKASELNKELSESYSAKRDVYKKTGKALRREKWNTFKRTTREGLAVIPDMTFRFGKAAKRAIVEVGSVFHKSAKKAQEGYSEPTPFSITREKPVVPAAKPATPEAPKA